MYRFALEPVLSHRDSLALTLQKELSDLERGLSQLEISLSEIKRRRENISLEFEKARKADGMTVAEILTTMRYLEAMANQIVLKKKQIQETRELCSQKRLLLIEAMKNKKAIERLKTKGFEQYTRELQKKEGSFLDEVSVTRFNDRSRFTQTSLAMPEGVTG